MQRRVVPIAQEGMKVKILVVAKLEGGQLFEMTPQNKPLEFVIGRNEVIKGLEIAVEGMRLGETKEVSIGPESAFGIRKQEHVQKMPRSAVPEGLQLEKGKKIAIQKENGVAFQAVIKDFDKQTVTLDFNHPLAGQMLHFEIKLVDIQAPVPREDSEQQPIQDDQ